MSLNDSKMALLSCFYCEKPLKVSVKNAIHVDHFVPWSFVGDDKIWNFVLTCSECNRKKNAKIPKDVYFIKLLERNKAFKSFISDKRFKDTIIGDEIRTYSENRLKDMYLSARKHLELW